MSNPYKVGILQINPHTLWRKGGGELHAAKYIEHGCTDQFIVEPFDFARAAEYDLIHYFGSAYQMNEIGKFAQAEGIKMVGTPILYPSGQRLKYKLFLQFGKRLPFPTTLNLRQELLEHTDALIANSQPEADYIADAYSIEQNKITTLGTGVSKNFCDYTFQESDLLKELIHFRPYALMVGRVTPLKNQLAVAKLFVNRKSNLVLLGKADPDEMGYLEELNKMVANNENIKWIEGVTSGGNELKAIYHQALCHILWSRTEVAALVNMEAMALGCPTLSRNLPTTTSIVKEYGLIAGSEKELLMKLDEIVNWDQEARNQYTAAAQEYVLRNHTWEGIVQKSLDIYSSLLST